MKAKTLIAAVALTLAATPALAQKPRHRAVPACADAGTHFSLVEMIFSTGPTPRPNGCAPAVHDGGRFVGQDPDPNVRLELRRNADNEGYHLNTR